MIVVRNKKVHSKKINGKWYLLEIDKKSIRELNSVAGSIWDSLVKPKSTDSLTQIISGEYKVSKQKAKRDIETFVAQNLKEGYLVEAKAK